MSDPALPTYPAGTLPSGRLHIVLGSGNANFETVATLLGTP